MGRLKTLAALLWLVGAAPAWASVSIDLNEPLDPSEFPYAFPTEEDLEDEDWLPDPEPTDERDIEGPVLLPEVPAPVPVPVRPPLPPRQPAPTQPFEECAPGDDACQAANAETESCFATCAQTSEDCYAECDETLSYCYNECETYYYDGCYEACDSGCHETCEPSCDVECEYGFVDAYEHDDYDEYHADNEQDTDWYLEGYPFEDEYNTYADQEAYEWLDTDELSDDEDSCMLGLEAACESVPGDEYAEGEQNENSPERLPNGCPKDLPYICDPFTDPPPDFPGYCVADAADCYCPRGTLSCADHSTGDPVCVAPSTPQWDYICYGIITI